MDQSQLAMFEPRCVFVCVRVYVPGFVRCAAPTVFHAPVRAVRRAAPRCGMAVMRMLFTIWIGLDYRSSVLSHREPSFPNSRDLCTARNGHAPARGVTHHATATCMCFVGDIDVAPQVSAAAINSSPARTAHSPAKLKVVCKYYQTGSCTNGENCPFLHQVRNNFLSCRCRPLFVKLVSVVYL